MKTINSQTPSSFLIGGTLLTLALSACGGEDVAPDVEVSQGYLLADAAAETTRDLLAVAEVAEPVLEVETSSEDLADGTRATYARRMRCASVSIRRGRVSVDFGTGCTIHGRTVAGAFTLTATRAQGSVGFGLELDGLSSGGVTRTGTVALSVAAGQLASDIELELTQGGSTTDLLYAGTLTAVPGGVEIDGTAARDDGTRATSLGLSSVAIDFGDCYPHAGTVTVDATGSPTTVVTFSAQTPSTGEVTVQIGRLPPAPYTLPACPF